MRYVIDTYNLLHAAIALGGPLRDMSVRKICRYLCASPAHAGATLVLDGRSKPDEPAAGDFPSVTLVYAGTGVTADRVIAQTVERATERRKVTVVTNDRAVALHARSHFANAMSCEAFLDTLTQAAPNLQDEPAHKTTGTPTTGESDHWMREFGLHDDPNPRAALQPDDPNPDDLDIEGLLGPRA